MIEITLEKINQPEFLSQLQKEWEDVLFHLDTVRAAKIDNQLSSLLKQATLSDQPKEDYNNLLIRFRWVALPHLSINKIIELTINHLLLGLTLQDFDLLSQLKSFLKMFDPWTRDEPKKQILDALRNNVESLPSWEKVKVITVKDWLDNYDKELGTGLAENIKQASYFVRRLSTLSSSDQIKLKAIFKIYEYLKITSKDLKNFDDEFIFTNGIGDILIPKDGRLIKVYDVSRAKTALNNPTTVESIPVPLSSPTTSQGQAIKPISQVPPSPILSKTSDNALPPSALPISDSSSLLPSAVKDDDDLILPPSLASNNSIPMTTINLDYQSTINQLITQLGLSFVDELLKNRFNNIITSYLKGIRKETELRDALARDQKTGGMGYDQIMINSVIDKIAILKKALIPEIKKIINKPSLAEGLTSPAEMVIPQSEAFKSGSEKLLTEPENILLPAGESADLDKEKKQFISGPLSPPVTEVKPFVVPSAPASPPSSEKNPWNLDLSSEVAESNLLTPPPINLPETPGEINFGLFDNQPSDGLLNNFTPLEKDFLTGQAADDKNVSSKLNKDPSLQSGDLMGFDFNQPPEPPALPPIPVTDALSTKSMPQQSTIQNVYHTTAPTPKPVMEEIRVTPKIYGPIDELKTITMEDWRRWGTAKEGSKRILDKINLLAEESLVKKSQGITAWKNSAVNRMYLDIGTEAIDNGLSVEQVIAKRQQENRPALTIEEFNAVSELNQNLRF